MFVAMNRFKVFAAEAEAFETVWRERDRHLDEVPGFVAFHLLRGAAEGDTVLYASHTVWRSREDFENWTRSDAFRKAHRNAGQNKPLYAGHPQFEGFEAVIEEPARAAA
ncbi:antibiotic biosynthesis monooxygenase [Methylopila jiangsuensis]|uniref:Antibiotic biosynthesis monooxygenase n=1 Tax=Methylopila jiangsuensis TaxID=586230 RepID=A0A9W6JD43_9HYPH|nr:antibiotic biosynthesis monooxygenase [Methylopila jiangsuensis]MDR6287228.1 heme-degrading monooxygenase HmoA [Methylopila jiangsuensis]GLK74812.1 antibiotic biosynthesis monooxygenase [Methylopila jiangsuensis]